ncbi:Uncharacterised protein [Paenibacillus thiaminolyticus]|nr:Uncharacterised protein [Paenibacillus thiaminolyticus]
MMPKKPPLLSGKRSYSPYIKAGYLFTSKRTSALVFVVIRRQYRVFGHVTKKRESILYKVC